MVNLPRFKPSRPNGFSNGLVHSNRISSGANFAKDLRPLATNSFAWLAAGGRYGGRGLPLRPRPRHSNIILKRYFAPLTHVGRHGPRV